MKRQRKECRIYIRVTQKDYEKICEASGGNISAYCREILLNQAGEKTEEKDWREITYQIRKIGVNINQVAARVNAGYSFSGDQATLLREMDKIYGLLQSLQEKDL